MYRGENYQSSWKRSSTTGNVYWGKTTKVHENDHLVQGMYTGEKLPKFTKTIIYYRECILGKNYQSSRKRSSSTGNVYWGKTTKVHENDYLVQGMYTGEKLPKFMKTII